MKIIPALVEKEPSHSRSLSAGSFENFDHGHQQLVGSRGAKNSSDYDCFS
jgi:hypothetical protein